MTTYIITFEVGTEETRQKLRALMKEYPKFCPIHKYCWAVMTEGEKAADIRTNLAAVLQPSDRIFVMRSGTGAAWRNSYGEKNNQWLKENL